MRAARSKTTSAPLQDKDANANSAPSATESTDTALKRGKKRSSDASGEKTAPAKKQKSSAVTKKDKNAEYPPDISDIKLDGEESNSVPIFDTCDDIRKKISDHLLKMPKASQASFARELNNLVPMSDGDCTTTVDGRPQAGASTMAFYAAYVYFEKLRLKEGKKKSKKRQEMEEVWAEEGGMPRKGSENVRITCIGTEKAKLDRLGRLQITGDPYGRGSVARKPLK